MSEVQSHVGNPEAGSTEAMPLLQESAMERRISLDGWHSIPADDIGYLDPKEFLTWTDDKVREFVAKFEATRYGKERNWNNLWRSTLGLDTTHGKRVLDYGCGFGIEALQFAKSGNQVELMDIWPDSVAAAARVLEVSGYKPTHLQRGEVDVFYSNGCLHHCPDIREKLQWAADMLAPGGEIRLLLYSDKAWTVKTATELPPILEDVSTHPAFWRFVRAMDAVGEYADWFSRKKLEFIVGNFLEIVNYDYITEQGIFCTVTLKPRANNGN